MTGNLSGLNPMIYNRSCRRVSGYLWQLYGNTNNNTDTSHRVGDWALSVLKVGQTGFNENNKQAQTEGWRECVEAMQTKKLNSLPRSTNWANIVITGSTDTGEG